MLLSQEPANSHCFARRSGSLRAICALWASSWRSRAPAVSRGARAARGGGASRGPPTHPHQSAAGRRRRFWMLSPSLIAEATPAAEVRPACRPRTSTGGRWRPWASLFPDRSRSSGPACTCSCVFVCGQHLCFDLWAPMKRPAEGQGAWEHVPSRQAPPAGCWSSYPSTGVGGHGGVD